MNKKRKQGMSFVEIVIALVIFAILIVFGTTIFNLISSNYNYYEYRLDQMAEAQGTVEASYIGLNATTIQASYSGIGTSKQIIIGDSTITGIVIPTTYATTGELYLFVGD